MNNKIARLENSRFLILFPAILSLCVLWSRYGVPDLSADGVTYMQIARNILLKGELGWQALWASPLHSILIAVTSRLTGISDLLVATSFTAPAMGLLLVVAAYKLGEGIFDRKTALVAASITAISPHLLNISFSTEPEITYTALLILSFALFSRAITGKSFMYASVSGISFALAYLARSEGFLIMVFALLSIAAVQGKQFYRSYAVRICVVTTLFFFITAAPYLFFLHKHYGAFVISPKASYVITWIQRADRNGHDALNKDLWGLTRDGRLKWQEPKGIGDLVRYLMSDPGKSISVYLKNLSFEIPGRIPNNSGMGSYPQLIPIYMAIAAIAALFLNWGALQKEKKALLVAPLLVFFVLPVFTSGWWKYLVPYLPFVILLASKGVTGYAARIAASAGFRNRLTAEFLIVSLLAGAVAIRYYIALHPPQSQSAPLNPDLDLRRNDAYVKREYGRLAALRFGPGRNYMVKWSKIVYYLDGLWTAFPLASHEEVLRYARQHKVDYIVLEITDPREMETVYYRQPGVELVEVFKPQEYEYMLAFYRLTF